MCQELGVKAGRKVSQRERVSRGAAALLPLGPPWGRALLSTLAAPGAVSASPGWRRTRWGSPETRAARGQAAGGGAASGVIGPGRCGAGCAASGGQCALGFVLVFIPE